MQRAGLFPTHPRGGQFTHTPHCGHRPDFWAVFLLEFGSDGHDQVHAVESVEAELEAEQVHVGLANTNAKSFLSI